MERDFNYLKSELKKQVTEKRYIHSLGVAETAKNLAKRYNSDEYKAELSGILHDYAKYWTDEQLIAYLNKEETLFADLLSYNKELWHGPAASIYVQERFRINDQDVINAIRYHTSGRVNMSVLEKIVCLADYIEPSRNYPGVDDVRELAKKDLNEGLVAALDSTIQFLIRDRQKIYPLTIKSRNYLIDELNKNEKQEGNEWV